MTFSDYDTFWNNFPGQKQKETTRQSIHQKICPVTRLPAKYFDPVTRLPYANLQAFRTLREAYHTQLELMGDRNDPEVNEWLEWRLISQSQNQTATIKEEIKRKPEIKEEHVVTAPPRLVYDLVVHI